MQFIYYPKQTVATMSEINKFSGYTCPFTCEDCVYMDSLSMTKTIICSKCENFIPDKNIDNDIAKSALTFEA